MGHIHFATSFITEQVWAQVFRSQGSTFVIRASSLAEMGPVMLGKTTVVTNSASGGRGVTGIVTYKLC